MSAIKRIVALAAALTLFCGAGHASSGRYTYRNAEKDTFVRSIITSGEIEYLTNAAFFMPVSGATLTSMDISRGDVVEAGDVIGTYTIEVNPADIVRAENALAHAKADAEYEISRLAAQADEYLSLSAEAKNADEARIYELKAEKCRLESEKYSLEAQAHIASLETEYDRIVASSQVQEIKAPISGEIDSATSSGIPVEQGKMLMSMHNSTEVLVCVEDFAGDLRYGMEVDLKLTYHSRSTPATGTVVSCDSVLPASLRTGKAYIAYDAAEKGSAFNGATVSAEILRVEDAVIGISDALTVGDGGYYVRILDDDGTVRTRYINRGFENNGDVWIISGVQDGDKLIIK